MDGEHSTSPKQKQTTMCPIPQHNFTYFMQTKSHPICHNLFRLISHGLSAPVRYYNQLTETIFEPPEPVSVCDVFIHGAVKQ